MKSVIEYPEFVRRAVKEFGESGREDIVTLLSDNPKSGVRMEHGGGIRKLDWPQPGRRGDTFVVYFHASTRALPLAIVAIFKKGEKQVPDKLIEILIHGKRG
jgi:hypothetical protein